MSKFKDVVFRALISTALACVFMRGALADPSAKTDDPIATLKLLIAGQAQNLSKIKSYTATLIEDVTANGGNRSYVAHAENKEIHQGNSIFIDRSRHLVHTPKDGPRTSEELPQRLVINDKEKYLLRWIVGSPLAYMYEYEALDKLPKTARHFKMTASPYNPSLYGFGMGDDTLEQFVSEVIADSAAGAARIEVERTSNQDSADLYLVKIASPDTPGKQVLEMTIDASRGCLVTHFVGRDFGQVFRENKEDPTEAAPGIWFPKAWEDTWFSDPTADTKVRPTVYIHVSVTVSALKLNVEIPPETFTPSSLGFTPNIRIMREDVRGGHTTLAFTGQELLPFGGQNRSSTSPARPPKSDSK